MRIVTRVAPGGPELVAAVAGTGPTALVLVHGFPFDHTMWEEQIRDLAGEAALVAPDLRGLGRSGLPPGGRATLADHTGDLVAWMDHLGMERAVVAGLSMGGYVAFDMWRRHPARVAGLALVDTRPEEDPVAVREARVATSERIRAEGMRAVCDDMLANVLGRTTRRNRPRVVRYVRDMVLRTRPEGAMAALHAMRRRPDSGPDLPTIGVATVVIVGEEDTLTPPPVARAMADAIPGAELVIIPRSGHVTSLETPTAVTAELRRLLERAASA